jgi:CheY-like chemotaxis protein
MQAMQVDYTPDHIEARFWKRTEPDGDQRSAESRRSAACDQRSKRLFPILEGANKGRILIVDDDESVRETLADLLEILGYRPLQAADAREALIILHRDADVDVLVTDLTMPGMDGITLIRYARELRHNLPAILLTGYAEQVASSATIAGDAFHVLHKPVESGRLIEQLELLVTKSRCVEAV